MNMDERSREEKVKRMIREGKIKDVISDALFNCGIEHDKISFEQREPLRGVVEKIFERYANKIIIDKNDRPKTEMLSITRETLEILVGKIYAQIIQGLEAMGIKELEESERVELMGVVHNIIQYEKQHRDAEREKEIRGI